MITLQEALNGQIKEEDLTPELRANVLDLLEKVNKFRKEYGVPMYVSSGYRSPEHNAKIGGAKNSAHMHCQAIDFKDVDGKLKEFIAKDPAILERCDLYMEDPEKTLTWVHMQSRKTSSGNRVFKI